MATNARDVVAADFNGDGTLDVAVLIPPNYSTSPMTPAAVRVALGRGDGSFAPYSTYMLSSGSNGLGGADTLLAVDLNNDGHPEIVVPNLDADTVDVLVNNGQGAFAFASYPAYYAPDSVAAGHFNHDGKIDLAITNLFAGSGGAVTMLLGNGDGTFAAPVSSPLSNYPQGIAAGDFNHDGRLDLAVSTGSGAAIAVFPGNGDGTFGQSTTYAMGSQTGSVVAGDFNGDGNIDLATALGSAGQLGVLTGDGQGGFSTPSFTPASGAGRLVIGDLNKDSLSDLVAPLSGGVGVFLAVPEGPPILDGTFGSGATAVAIADANGDGKLDLITAGTSGVTVLFQGSGTC